MKTIDFIPLLDRPPGAIGIAESTDIIKSIGCLNRRTGFIRGVHTNKELKSAPSQYAAEVEEILKISL